MKNLIGIISLLSLIELSIMAQASLFHKIGSEALSMQKSDICFTCHISDLTTNSSETSWLQPKDFTDVTIQNLDDSYGEPDSFSKACLICHDGSEASLVMNAPISPCGIKSDGMSVSEKGKNHPVFMTYGIKNDLHNPFELLSGMWNDAEKVGDLLRDEKIVCISCHTPHHNEGMGYLRTSNVGSALCLGCHNK